MAQKLRPQAETLSGSPQPNFVGYSVAPIIAKRIPTTLDLGYPLGQTWVDKVGGAAYTLVQVAAGVATWALSGTDTGALNTLTGDSGGAISPSAGNISLLGTANQIVTTGSGSQIAFSLASPMVTPGNLSVVGTLSSTGATTLATTGASVNTFGNATGATSVNITNGTGASGWTSTNGTLTLISGTGALAISNDAAATTVSLGTGAGVKAVSVGSTNSTSSTTVQSGSGALAITATGGTLTANSGTGALGISTDASATTVSLATGGAVKTVTLGSTNTTSVTTVACGTGGCNLGTSANAHSTTVGSTTTTSDTLIQSGSNGISIAATGGSINIGPDGATVNIANGSPGANTVQISTGAAVNTLTLGSTNTTSTTTIQAGSGGINLAGNVNLTSVATKISLNGGAVTDFIGQAVLLNGTVSVANTNIAATDRIFVTRSAKNGSTAYGTFLTAITPTTSFSITSAKSDTTTETGDASTVDYIIFRQT